MPKSANDNPFDQETWELLPTYFENLPHPVRIHIWGDPEASQGEKEAKRLIFTIADRFAQIDAAVFPRRINYPYYPVIGIFGYEEGEPRDFGARIIGLPSGLQITSLIAAVQAVAFQGGSLEAKTRVQLKGLKKEVRLELLTAADDEAGVVLAKTLFGLAASSPYIRSFLIMADVFPVVSVRYSAAHLPHTVINGRSHVEGVISEGEMLQKIAAAVR